MSQHRVPGEDTSVMSNLFKPPTAPVQPLALSSDAHPVQIIHWVFSIIKNLLVIALLIVVFVVGHRFVTGINDVRQQVGTFNTPADAPLPVDQCGGGVC